jgi:hypothetical protein
LGASGPAQKTKIIREIAGVTQELVVTLAQTMPPTNCMIGEILRQQRWGN